MMNETSQDRRLVLHSLKQQLKSGEAQFAHELRLATEQANEFDQLFALSTLRRKAGRLGLWPAASQSLRIALVGGSSLSPFSELLAHLLEVQGIHAELWLGQFDNYVSEITDPASGLYAFQPQAILILPSERNCRYSGDLSASVPQQREQADQLVGELIALVSQAHTHAGAEVIVANFRLPCYHDPGPLRYRLPASDYAFRKYVNLQLGQMLPGFAHLCDVEFLANRRGTLAAFDERTWFESKQAYAADFAVDVAREFAHIIAGLHKAPKKVVVMDLDNTLWGGVVGDDGVDGIEIGTTSPRGEAFRDFQQYLSSLTSRGVLLAVCSKNDADKAMEPFETHPEMVLRRKDLASFQANWEPKSENIRRIAAELNLGLDSLVFVDDNPAEIAIVRQFVPEVTCIHLGDDPSQFSRLLKESRLFELRQLTAEDTNRARCYQVETERNELRSIATDMDSYLTSLEMVAEVHDFRGVDVPRIAQLINKSNQFNLTTKRRTEAEVTELIGRPQYSSFTLRLADRFGDHGLIAIVIGSVEGNAFKIDTWLMSCRVLKRQVEELTLNEILLRAQSSCCERIIGEYLPTEKNGIVQDLYPSLSFTLLDKDEHSTRYELPVSNDALRSTKIQRMEEAHAARGSA